MTIDLTKTIYDKMVNQQFLMSVTGRFNQVQLLSLLKITDNKLSAMEMDKGIKTKIFHFMIECAQNLSRIEQHKEITGENIFLIGKTENQYTIHLGSSVKKSDGEEIKQLLDTVNNLATQEVKTKFYLELKSKTLVNQNPLLMSLLDISRKTKEKIKYELVEIDEHKTFLSFTTTFSNLKHSNGTDN